MAKGRFSGFRKRFRKMFHRRSRGYGGGGFRPRPRRRSGGILHKRFMRLPIIGSISGGVFLVVGVLLYFTNPSIKAWVNNLFKKK